MTPEEAFGYYGTRDVDYSDDEDDEMATTTPSPTASDRAEQVLREFGLNGVLFSSNFVALTNRVTAAITAAEQAAEARGAERMRERCKAEAHTWNAPLSFVNALAALPLEEGKE